MKSKKTINNYNCPLILKSGATDLRRQEKALTNLIEQKYPKGIKNNFIYGFSNKNNTAIKLLKTKPDTSIILIKLKRNKPYPWPEYMDNGSYIVTYTGEKKKIFLKKLGFKRVIYE